MRKRREDSVGAGSGGRGRAITTQSVADMRAAFAGLASEHGMMDVKGLAKVLRRCGMCDEDDEEMASILSEAELTFMDRYRMRSHWH